MMEQEGLNFLHLIMKYVYATIKMIADILIANVSFDSFCIMCICRNGTYYLAC